MERGKETLERAREAWRKGIRPVIPEALQPVLGLAGRVGKLNAQILAEAVKREPVLVERLLRAAHSAGFNPQGNPIYSLTQAIAVVGFDTVRTQTRGLYQLERSGKRMGTEVRKYAGLRCVVTGWLAQEMATMGKAAAPEVAYLAASLRGFGRMVLAGAAPVEFHAALAMEAETDERTAFLEVFGVTPREVSRHLLQHARFGTLLTRVFEECPEEIYGQELASPEMRLLVLTNIAESAAFWILRGDCKEETFRARMEELAPRASGVLPDLMGKLERLLLRLDEHLRLMARECEMGAVPMNVLDCVQSRVEHKDPQESVMPKIEEEEEVGVQEVPPMATLEDWQAALEEYERIMRRGEEEYMMARRYLLACLQQGYRADECWMFLPVGEEMVLVDGVGKQVEGLKFHARFRLGAGGLLDASYRRGENVFLRDVKDGKFLRHMPAWFRHGVDLRAVLFLTYKLKEGLGTLLMVGWKGTSHPTQPREIQAMIQKMLERFLEHHEAYGLLNS